MAKKKKARSRHAVRRKVEANIIAARAHSIAANMLKELGTVATAQVQEKIDEDPKRYDSAAVTIKAVRDAEVQHGLKLVPDITYETVLFNEDEVYLREVAHEEVLALVEETQQGVYDMLDEKPELADVFQGSAGKWAAPLGV